ncbi:MAG TPA: ribose 5-phosphate isomerase B [Anaerolineae bacterium]|nr:ribose 5-phosphate isomerase B [Anaerolineae bacterium]
MSIQEAQVRELVRAVLHRTLGLATTSDRSGAAPAVSLSPALTEQRLAALAPGTTVRLAPDQIITPLARDIARERGITVLEPAGAVQPIERATATRMGQSPSSGGTVALGADHGGYELKQTLRAYLTELGYAPLDCGTFSTEAVDYPDYALAVAELVASGRAWRGIVVDGAGIGSCITANKVPHIRAALCYDQATAVNSREHNDANVLTLGAGLIGPALAKQIVKTWLSTPFGGGRHAQRVNKIIAIEQRFLK